MENIFLLIGYLTTAIAIVEIFTYLIKRLIFICIKRHIDKDSILSTDLKFNKNVRNQFDGDVTMLFDEYPNDKNGKLQFYISCFNTYVSPILVLGYEKNHAIRVVVNLTIWEFSKIYVCNKLNINYNLSPNVIREVELKCHEYMWRQEQIMRYVEYYNHKSDLEF